VIAVSAFADTDGAPGGQGPWRCGHSDDWFATFSNFGADADIAAPGVCIRSTSLGSWYAKLSGTSMAAPHVTGAVAFYLTETPRPCPVTCEAGCSAPPRGRRTRPRASPVTWTPSASRRLTSG
jgi:subtilisin